jgi:hypothetical protein
VYIHAYISHTYVKIRAVKINRKNTNNEEEEEEEEVLNVLGKIKFSA